MNVAVLEKVRDHILEDPRRLNMRDWIWHYTDNQVRLNSDILPPCGTVGCIAGWILELYGHELEKETGDIVKDAAKLLGVDLSEACCLFHLEYWPKDYQIRYRAGNQKERAQVTAERINRLIKEHQ